MDGVMVQNMLLHCDFFSSTLSDGVGSRRALMTKAAKMIFATTAAVAAARV